MLRLDNTTSTTITNNITTTNNQLVYYLHLSFIVFIVLHILYFLYVLIQYRRHHKEVIDPKTGLRKINEECSICMENISNEVQLLCSHSYCGKCLMAYAEQKFSGLKIKCPICRQQSKLIIAQFEEDSTNSELCQQIAMYNNEITSYHKNSLCLLLDMCKFTQFFFKQLINVNNHEYNCHRLVISGLLIVCVLVAVVPFFEQGDWGEFIMDLVLYIIVLLVASERFYQGLRSRTITILARRATEENVEVDAPANNEVNGRNERNERLQPIV